ncbi:MAG: hypothetical protein DHS20C18_01140 [Saprospiraceae bacterium]|nr:MAG: hypothetical protein DHS20C18_01140 [Saprospiraceae bacterium]
MVPPRKYYVFRAATSVSELKSLLQLRYRGYLESKCASLMHENLHGLDLDGYDMQARHFGLFECNGRTERPIGYIRFAQDTVSPQLKEIWQLSMGYPDLVNQLEYNPNAPYPVLGHLEDSGPVNDFYKNICSEGKSMVEGSRMVLDSAYRSLGFSRFIIEAAVSVCLYSFAYDFSVLACVPNHRRFYERFGFTNLHTSVYDDVKCHIMLITQNQLSNQLRNNFEQMAEAFSRFNALYYYPKVAGQYTPMPIPQPILDRTPVVA